MLLNRILWADCRVILPLLPDQSFTLAFADPPYWVGFDYGSKRDTEMAYVDPTWLVEELRRLAKVVCVTPGNGNQHLYPTPDWVMAWVKPGGVGKSKIGGFSTWEPILVYGKSKRIWQDSIILPDISNHAQDVTYHKCPKPLKLLTWLMEGFTEPGDAVLDPFMGSGTTAKACKMLGRSWFGCDTDRLAVEEAHRRLAHTPTPLLVLPPTQTEMAI